MGSAILPLRWFLPKLPQCGHTRIARDDSRSGFGLVEGAPS
jgi:hypothetical protein